jgi:cell division protein FtsI/penicillin-binding protein 2
MGRAHWLQFVDAAELQNDEDNRRLRIEAFAQPRGDIIVGGKAITGSQETTSGDLRYKRSYQDGPLYAPVTGYFSQAQGATFLEGVEDGLLDGTDPRLRSSPTDWLTGQRQRGADIVTTIDPAAQRAAYEGLTALDGARGAVVALEPSTGRVLALASAPSYDPAEFAGATSAEGDVFQRLDNAPGKPLVNRALRETYPPGSTFKILTAAAALEHGVLDDIDSLSDAPSPYRMPLSSTTIGSVVPDEQCEDVSMKTALQWSCNNVFLDAALETGPEKMRETAEKFGFNAEQFLPVRASSSLYPRQPDQPQTALTGMGQGSVTSTPLQMAMVAAGIANDGTVMKPHLVDEIRASDLTVIDKTEPEVLSKAVSAGTAAQVRQAMEFTVTDGTGSAARITGVTVGGKPGTAQHGVDVRDERPYAWFVAYADGPDGEPAVAVAVFVDPAEMSVSREDIAGGRLAGPIAKSVMEAALRR